MATVFMGLPLVAFILVWGGSFESARSIALWASMVVLFVLVSFWWFVDAAGFGQGVRGGSWFMLLVFHLKPL
jgi:hypothetical protein